MFEKLKDEDDEELGPGELRGKRNVGVEAGLGKGSAERYRARIEKFEKDGKPWPKLRHHALWMLHNLVAHPILGVMPIEPVVELHELTSAWLNHVPSSQSLGSWTDRFRDLHVRIPKIKRPSLWALHNLVGHVAIGLVPCKATFKLHDWTAKLAVPGWV
jgi:hypothetical protein